MQKTGIKVTVGVLAMSMLFLPGCGGPNASTAPARMVCGDAVTKAQVIQAAEHVLTRMQFPIEKLDAEQGVVRTRPLRGAQFFEFWRSDNVRAYDGAEASLQSVRRSVELRVKPEGGGDGRLCVECAVAVQRLSLPGNEVTGVSSAYGIYARNTPTLQRVEMNRQVPRGMAWIDLGPDRALAARILDRIDRRLQHAD